MTIKNFTIFGERNSGTNYLIKVLGGNLRLPFTEEYGFKHWFIKGHQPRGRPNQTTDNQCIRSLNDSDQTLFIFIVRNPYDWFYSTFKKPYHIKTKYKNFVQFISHAYISYEMTPPKRHRGKKSKLQWFKDEKTNTYFVDESKNIITLRNEKNTHFYSLRNRVKHFALIRQEHLKEDIEAMVEKFGLQLKHDSFQLNGYRNPTSYKKHITPVAKKKIKKFLNNEIDTTFYPEM